MSVSPRSPWLSGDNRTGSRRGSSSTISRPTRRHFRAPPVPSRLKVRYAFAAVATPVGETPNLALPSCTNPGAPIADFSFAPDSPDEGAAVQFVDRSADPDFDQTAWEWDFGDGSVAEKHRNPTHRFSDNGTYTVRLTVTDAKGNRASEARAVTVRNLPPTATIGNVSIPRGQSAQITFTIGDPGEKDREDLHFRLTLNPSGSTLVEGHGPAAPYTVPISTGPSPRQLPDDPDGHGRDNANEVATASLVVALGPAMPLLAVDGGVATKTDGGTRRRAVRRCGSRRCRGDGQGAGHRAGLRVVVGGRPHHVAGRRTVVADGPYRSTASPRSWRRRPTRRPRRSRSRRRPAPGQELTLANRSRDAAGQPIGAVLTLGNGSPADPPGGGRQPAPQFPTAGVFTVSLTATDGGGRSTTVTRWLPSAGPDPDPDARPEHSPTSA